MTGRYYRRYLVFVLAIVLGFTWMDRYALAIAVQNIKGDLGLSDTEIGFLTGIAFAMFYSTAGIPIARWADRGNRVFLISMALVLWSGTVILSGVARSFGQLVLARIGVAVGEASCGPASFSLISDYFAGADRPRAVALYSLGIPASMVFGYFVAGWLNQIYGWRVMFMAIGLPGVVVASIVRFTLKEPRGRRMKRVAKMGVAKASGPITEEVHLSPPKRSLWGELSSLWGNRTFRQILFALCANYFFGNGVYQWQAAFFIRSYGLQTEDLGMWLAMVGSTAYFLGTYAGGYLASQYAGDNEALQLRSLAFCNSFWAMASTVAYLVHNYYAAFGMLWLGNLAVSMGNGPVFATIQTVVGENQRAFSISVVYLFANLIGLGLGPLAVGALSDALRPEMGRESLRYALVAVSPGSVWGAFHLWRASVYVRGDIARSRDRDSGYEVLE